jgi:hypothetical protein
MRDEGSFPLKIDNMCYDKGQNLDPSHLDSMYHLQLCTVYGGNTNKIALNLLFKIL